jgi:hypothetical protein
MIILCCSGINGKGDENQVYQPVFNSNLSVENGEHHRYEQSNNSHSEQSHGSIDDSAEAYRQAGW